MSVFFDLTLLGIYYIIKPIYILFDRDESTFGAAEHALIIIWFVHSTNINNVVGLFIDDSFYFKLVTFSLMSILLLVGLFIYYKRNRLNEVIIKKRVLSKKILISIATLIYGFFSIYFFF